MPLLALLDLQLLLAVALLLQELLHFLPQLGLLHLQLLLLGQELLQQALVLGLLELQQLPQQLELEFLLLEPVPLERLVQYQKSR